MNSTTNQLKSSTELHQPEKELKGLKKFIVEFCSNTTIHGFRYFTERNRHWTERCWWIVSLALSVWCCGSFLIRNIWMNWCDNPVTMSITENQVPISTIPFPMVTICPEVKVYRKILPVASLDTRRSEWNITGGQLTVAKTLAHMCSHFWRMFNPADGLYVNASIYYILQQMAPTFGDTIRTCMWPYASNKTAEERRIDRIDCKALFVSMLTADGFCFAFNALNSKEIYREEVAPELFTVVDQPDLTHWSLEGGYNDTFDPNIYPYRAFSARENGVLDVHARSLSRDIEFVCRTLVPGFKIFLHTPGDVIKENDRFIRVPFSNQVDISIKPKLVTTNEGLRNIDPTQRQCFFKSERYLRFFEHYSQGNCEIECIANYTLHKCNCVRFSLPRNDSTKICGTGKIRCYKKAYTDLFEEDVVDGLSSEEGKLFRHKCNCLPGCTTIAYEPDVERTTFDWQTVLLRKNHSVEEIARLQVSRIRIFFDNHEILMLRRGEQYTYTDFLAICGGLLGLCLGVSALSIIEFIYYYTLRLFWTLQRRNYRNNIVSIETKPTEKMEPGKFRTSRNFYR